MLVALVIFKNINLLLILQVYIVFLERLYHKIIKNFYKLVNIFLTYFNKQ